MTTTDEQTVSFDVFRKAYLELLDETFDNVQGAFLDPGDSLFPTLASVTASQASKVVGSCGNSIAGQVNHLIFYFDVGFEYMQGRNPGRQDWAQAWKTIEVTDDEWESLKQQLRERQQRLIKLLQEYSGEMNEDIVGGAFATLAHTAFHLGQIRHALCMLGPEAPS